jgi:hypothetical protein
VGCCSSRCGEQHIGGEGNGEPVSLPAVESFTQDDDAEQHGNDGIQREQHDRDGEKLGSGGVQVVD